MIDAPADREILAGDLRLLMSNRGHKDTAVRAANSPYRPCKAMCFRTGAPIAPRGCCSRPDAF
jgi:hypothetical protein